MFLTEKRKRKRKKRVGSKNSLWKNVWARKDAGLRPLRPGEEGYPKTLNVGKKKKKNESQEISVDMLRVFINECISSLIE